MRISQTVFELQSEQGFVTDRQTDRLGMPMATRAPQAGQNTPVAQ